MTFKPTIELLMSGSKLGSSDAYALMSRIGEGAFSEAQNTALIVALSCRDVTIEELSGFRHALLDLSLPTTLEQYDAIDLCGTGGDEKNTFNISTLASFIVAAAGYKVIKHGNYGVSSVSGSSNILEKLGYVFSSDQSKLERELDELNICFLHAPLFHPALKHVAGARKQLGIKTVFNTLGPLVNPARTKKQFAGVYNLKLARLYHYLLQQEGKDYAVVHSLDGYDEVSLTTDAQCFSSRGEEILKPSDFDMPLISQESLHGGDTPEAALAVFLQVIGNRGTEAQASAVIANAAMGIRCFEKESSLTDCVSIARETLENGKANQLLINLIKKQSHA